MVNPATLSSGEYDVDDSTVGPESTYTLSKARC